MERREHNVWPNQKLRNQQLPPSPSPQQSTDQTLRKTIFQLKKGIRKSLKKPLQIFV